jgi:hypothetical protein
MDVVLSKEPPGKKPALQGISLAGPVSVQKRKTA